MSKALCKIISIMIACVFVVGVILAVCYYPKYGHGLSYYLLVIFPLLSLLTGMSGILLRKRVWAVIAIVQLVILLLFLVDSAFSPVALLYNLIYVVISVASGAVFCRLSC